MIANLSKVLAAGAPGAVASFNVLDADMALALRAAAEENSRPLVLGLAARHAKAVDVPVLAAALARIAEHSRQPVAIHLDHAGPAHGDLIRQVLDAGFTSIMIDGSTLPLEENIKLTGPVVALAKKYGASVEGELGAIAGEEGVADTHGAALKSLGYTDAGEAKRYVEATGIDALAVAVGTAHGIYAAAPTVSFETIARVREAVAVPLVLHGATGVRPEDIRRCVREGIRKINFFSGLLEVAMNRIRADAPQLGHDYLELKKRLASEWKAIGAEQIKLYATP